MQSGGTRDDREAHEPDGRCLLSCRIPADLRRQTSDFVPGLVCSSGSQHAAGRHSACRFCIRLQLACLKQRLSPCQGGAVRQAFRCALQAALAEQYLLFSQLDRMRQQPMPSGERSEFWRCVLHAGLRNVSSGQGVRPQRQWHHLHSPSHRPAWPAMKPRCLSCGC